jgi:hypothetical protein
MYEYYTFHGVYTEISGFHSDIIIMVFRDVTQNSLADNYQDFGRTYSVLLQGRRRRSRLNHKVGSCLRDVTFEKSAILFVLYVR